MLRELGAPSELISLYLSLCEVSVLACQNVLGKEKYI